VLATLRTQHDVGWFDVAMDQADCVSFGECGTRHHEDPDDAALGLRTGNFDDSVEVRAVEELHRVVEDAVVGAPVVENGDRVRVGQARRQLDLAFEACEVAFASLIRAQELQGRRPAHHAVAGSVHLTHAALADLVLDDVLAELFRFTHREAQSVDDARGDGARRDDDGPANQKCRGHPRESA
jgi:hypothetical protein